MGKRPLLSKLITLIERHKLYRYDILGKTKRLKNKIPESIEISQTYIVQKGDTLYSISKQYNTTVARIKSLNNLDSNALSIGQTLVLISN